ncbi:dynein regulatory complex protein 10 isoform 1-T4 [Anableps anableps]
MFKGEATAEEDTSLMPNRKLCHEAQRISSVMENCISRVEIAAALPNILEFCAMSGVVDENLSKALQEHQVLEERLKKLECQKLDELEEKEGEEAKKREMVRLKENIKNSVRDVLRLFRVHPNVFWGLKEQVNMEVGENERALIRMLQMFHSYVEKRLCSEKPRVPQRQRPVFLDKTLELLISKEEDSVATLKDLDKIILQNDSEIKKLERYLKEQNMQAENELHLQQQQEQLHLIKLGAEISSLKEKKDQLNMQLSTLMLENRREERILQEENDSLKTETENILQSFDKEMREIQTKLELSEKSYENELEEVSKLEEPFSALQEQYNQIQEKRRVAEEKRKEMERELEMKLKATIVIQAWWKGYCVRKALKSRVKKGKKGKKRNKKKKK